MRIPRTRGAVSGLLLMILGAWGALIPFVGPYFDFVIGSDDTWDWSSGRFWLFVVPGVVAFVGGFLLFSSAHRARAGTGAWLAMLAGMWFVVGSTVSMLWNDGVSDAGAPAGSSDQQVLELLTMLYGLGAVVTALGAFALGRLAVRSVRDVELEREAEMEREREAEMERERELRTDEDLDRTEHAGPLPGHPVADRDETYDREAPVVGRDDTSERDRPLADDRPAEPAAPTGTAPPTSSSTTRTRRRGGLLERLRGH